MARGMRSGALALVLLASNACGARRAEIEIPQCTVREGELAGGVDAGSLVGGYRLILVAAGGERADQRAEGELVLMTVDSAALLTRVSSDLSQAKGTYQLVGKADLPLESVGAVRMGDLASLDPSGPGVAVMQRGSPEAPEMTLRLGSLANRIGSTLFDGGYAALRVRWIEAYGFGGSWASGVRDEEATGHFCAFRPATGR